MIYFIRHAATDGNLKNIWVGRDDQPVSLSAQEKLGEVAVMLSKIKFSKVYSSPLQRAASTAKIIKKMQINDIDIVFEPALIERDFAGFEGLLKTKENRKLMEENEMVESILEMKNRLAPFIMPMIRSDEKILIVSHSAVFKCLKNHMKLPSLYDKNSLCNLEWDVFL